MRRGKAVPKRRSGCPLNASVEMLGDRWSLLIIRDMMLAGARSYKQFLDCYEGIATNILADRLRKLVACGIITTEKDPSDGRKLIYLLTAKGIDLAPVLTEMVLWAAAHEDTENQALVRQMRADKPKFLAGVRQLWANRRSMPARSRTTYIMPKQAGRALMKHKYRILSAILLIGLFAAIVSVHAAGPNTETVKFPSGKETIEGYLAVPEKPGRYPAVIVIHEWWGLNDWVKEQTQKIAELGYVALAVDLYRGKTATDPNEAHELMRGMPQDRAVRDLQAGYDYLAARKDVSGRIGVVGWCMGGGYALQLAIHQPRLSACVVNYGALPTDPNDIQQIAAPVLGNFGADDHGITPADVKAFQKTLSGMGRYVDIKIYDGAGHAFENPNNEKGYRPEAAADAWSRTVVFLKKTMGVGDQPAPAKK